MLIDTHCHLNCSPLVDQLDSLLEEARAAGVRQWVVPGIEPTGWQGILDLCATIPEALPALGIHPRAAARADAQQLALLDRLAPQAVAIGEIGLDRGCNDLAAQEHVFRAQLRIACRHRLPVLIHCRGAIGRTLSVLHEERVQQVGGIMHAFSGSLETAQQCIKLGLVIALSGSLTYQGAVKPVRLARELPLEQLVLETDAPDMTPQRYKGRYNHPAWLRETATVLAEIKGMTIHEVASATTETALRVLRLINRPRISL